MGEEIMNFKSGRVEEEKWWETTLPIVLSSVLSFVLIVLIIILIVQCCKKRQQRQQGHVKPAKQQKEKKQKKEKCIKATTVKDVESGAPIMSDNGPLLVSGKRSRPTRKGENKSWYDSKVIPYIDDGGGTSLDNLYLPDAVRQGQIL